MINMQYIGIPSIIIICYLIGEISKLLILKKKKNYKYIPIIVGISGGILGLISYYISPNIVLNVKDVILTGNKLNQKIYRHHSGYIGGMKEVPAKVMLEKNPEKAMTLAVKGMLPHNSLGRKMATKLRVFAGSEHNLQAQKPEIWKF